MLLSLKYNFLFVHIAKTGGTSVRSALQRYRWRDPSAWCQAICNRMSDLWGHRLGVKIPRHARLICAKEMLPKEMFDRLFKFAFVRNPWDLQVSSWHHIRRERPHIIPSSIRTFDDFIKWKMDRTRPYHYIIDTSMELQWNYLIDLDGTPLIDFIGRYEQLGIHFQQACEIMKIDPPPLPHRRMARDRKKDYRSYYTDSLAELVATCFARDIDNLGYSFDGDGDLEPIYIKK